MSLGIKVKAARGGDKFEFKVDEKSSVKELKVQIEGASKIPSEQQRLIYKGHVLKDEQTMADISKSFQRTLSEGILPPYLLPFLCCPSLSFPPLRFFPFRYPFNLPQPPDYIVPFQQKSSLKTPSCW
jgi:hypothetical protein